MEYDKFAQGVVTSLGGNTPVMLPFLPSFIEISNVTRAVAANGVTRAWWEIEMGQGAAMLTTTSAGPVDGTSFITTATGTGFQTYLAYASNLYGASQQVNLVTQAGAAAVTMVAPHGLVTGDVVIFQNLYQTATTGMQQLCNIPFVITRTGATTFTIPINTTGGMYAAYNNGTATVQATMKKVLYPFLYAPGTACIASITQANPMVVTTTSPHNFVVGQEVAFRIPAAYGMTQLNPFSLSTIPGSPGYGYVTAVNSNVSVSINIDSTAFTAFAYPTVAQVEAGLGPAMIVAAGDNNSGSNQFGYNSPIIPTSVGTHTINGPAIAGAYINNTAMGFVIGSGVAGTAADTIYWRAYFASTL